jgi:hypothetical protein
MILLDRNCTRTSILNLQLLFFNKKLQQTIPRLGDCCPCLILCTKCLKNSDRSLEIIEKELCVDLCATHPHVSVNKYKHNTIQRAAAARPPACPPANRPTTHGADIMKLIALDFSCLCCACDWFVRTICDRARAPAIPK